MEVIVAFAASALLAYLLRRQVKRYAVSFYLAVVALDVLFLSRALFATSRELAVAVYPYFTRCLVGFALFAVVMYIGVLPRESRLRRAMMPIRGELSVIAAILTIGHVANYLGQYLAQIASGFAGMRAAMVASFAVSTLLIVLLTMLTVTSFNAVKTRMRPERWKALQRWAYAFFGLAYLHLLLVLAPTVSQAGQRAALSLTVYTAVVLGYAVLRLAVYACEKRRRAAEA